MLVEIVEPTMVHYRIHAAVVAVFVVLGAPAICTALNNGFTKPEMGFNTWEPWGCDISEEKVHAAADAMVAKG